MNDTTATSEERKDAQVAPAPSESPRAVGRFIEIVDALAEMPEGLTLAQLSAKTESPKSSLLALVRSLADSGHLLRTQDRYQLGPALFLLASKVQASKRFINLLRPIMQKLADASGESIYFAVLDGERESCHYSEGIESQQTVRYAANMGSARPLYCGAGASVLLAYQPQEWVDDYLRRAKLVPVTAATVLDPVAIRTRLAQIRAKGIAVSIGEAAPSAAGVAAPVLAASGELRGAMVLAAPVDRFLQQRATLEHLTKLHAKEASGL